MGGNPDPKVIVVCNVEQRILVTLDLDFADIRVYPPAQNAGIIVPRPANQAKTHALALLQRAIDYLDHENVVGFLWIVDEAGIRIR